MTATGVADALRRQIETGYYHPGQQLPSKSAVASEHSVATPTVQRAFDALAAEGLIAGRRGAGVFVLPPASSISLAGLTEEAFDLHDVSDTPPAWVQERIGAGSITTTQGVGSALDAVLLTRWEADRPTRRPTITVEAHPRAASPDERTLLNLRAGTPVLSVVRTHNKGDRVVLVERYTVTGSHIVALGEIAS